MRNRPNHTDDTDSPVEASGAPIETSGQPSQFGGTSGQPGQSQDIPLVSQTEVIARAYSGREDDSPLPPKYMVMQTCSTMYAGYRVTMRQGKIIDCRSFDVEKLRGQGVKLELVE